MMPKVDDDNTPQKDDAKGSGIADREKTPSVAVSGTLHLITACVWLSGCLWLPARPPPPAVLCCGAAVWCCVCVCGMGPTARRRARLRGGVIFHFWDGFEMLTLFLVVLALFTTSTTSNRRTGGAIKGYTGHILYTTCSQLQF
jgi:hypothetical protein